MSWCILCRITSQKTGVERILLQDQRWSGEGWGILKMKLMMVSLNKSSLFFKKHSNLLWYCRLIKQRFLQSVFSGSLRMQTYFRLSSCVQQFIFNYWLKECLLSFSLEHSKIICSRALTSSSISLPPPSILPPLSFFHSPLHLSPILSTIPPVLPSSNFSILTSILLSILPFTCISPCSPLYQPRYSPLYHSIYLLFHPTLYPPPIFPLSSAPALPFSFLSCPLSLSYPPLYQPFYSPLYLPLCPLPSILLDNLSLYSHLYSPLYIPLYPPLFPSLPSLPTLLPFSFLPFILLLLSSISFSSLNKTFFENRRDAGFF